MGRINGHGRLAAGLKRWRPLFFSQPLWEKAASGGCRYKDASSVCYKKNHSRCGDRPPLAVGCMKGDIARKTETHTDMERIIDTTDGEILVKTAYDCDTDTSYAEFYERDGYDEECFPWKFVNETPFGGDFDETTDEELEELYYENR